MSSSTFLNLCFDSCLYFRGFLECMPSDEHMLYSDGLLLQGITQSAPTCCSCADDDIDFGDLKTESL